MRVLLIVLLLIVCVVATARPSSEHPKVRSLHQACHRELIALCPSKKEMAKCLDSHRDEIKDEVCKRWVDARRLCYKELEGQSMCKGMRTRECIRKAKEDLLSEQCRESEYFQSIRLSRMVHHR